MHECLLDRRRHEYVLPKSCVRVGHPDLLHVRWVCIANNWSIPGDGNGCEVSAHLAGGPWTGVDAVLVHLSCVQPCHRARVGLISLLFTSQRFKQPAFRFYRPVAMHNAGTQCILMTVEVTFFTFW